MCRWSVGLKLHSGLFVIGCPFAGDSTIIWCYFIPLSRPNRNIYNRTGEKRSKLDLQYRKLADSLERDSIMERIQLIDEDKMIVLEIGGFLEEYELKHLYGIEDIETCIHELKQLKKKFEQVHVKLRRVLEEEHEELYKDYDYDVKKIGDWIKEARIEIRGKEKRIEVGSKEEENEKKAREKEVVKKLKVKLKAEGKYVGMRVERCLSNIAEENAEFIEDIERNISEVKYLMEARSELYSKNRIRIW